MPTLWIGTSLGSVQTVIFNTPVHSERHAHPVVVSTCSKQIFLILSIYLFLNITFTVISSYFKLFIRSLTRVWYVQMDLLSNSRVVSYRCHS